MIATTSAFRFRRYREEVALRLSLQRRTDTENKHKTSADTNVEHITVTNPNNRAKTKPRMDMDMDIDNGDSGDGSVIQNLFNVIVMIDLYGKVLTKKRTSDTQTVETNDRRDNSIQNENSKSDNINQQESIWFVPEGTTLLLRNLRDCHVIIHLPLPAVHFVGIENTEIIFYNKSKESKDYSNIDDKECSGDLSHTAVASTSTNVTKVSAKSNVNTTIHMTDCRGRSSLQLETSAQQLRIHRSIGLRVEMMNESATKTKTRNCQHIMESTTTMPPCDWKPGTIILEASKDIVFLVPQLNEGIPANQSQQDREKEESPSTTATTTKKYWQQVIVKDFQWLRKGIASPNFQIRVIMVSNGGSNMDKHSTENSTDTLESASQTLLHRNSNTKELEYGNSSDSEDEL